MKRQLPADASARSFRAPATWRPDASALRAQRRKGLGHGGLRFVECLGRRHGFLDSFLVGPVSTASTRIVRFATDSMGDASRPQESTASDHRHLRKRVRLSFSGLQRRSSRVETLCPRLFSMARSKKEQRLVLALTNWDLKPLVTADSCVCVLPAQVSCCRHRSHRGCASFFPSAPTLRIAQAWEAQHPQSTCLVRIELHQDKKGVDHRAIVHRAQVLTRGLARAGGPKLPSERALLCLLLSGCQKSLHELLIPIGRQISGEEVLEIPLAPRPFSSRC